jgi:hypothetical protein
VGDPFGVKIGDEVIAESPSTKIVGYSECRRRIAEEEREAEKR